MEEGEIFQIELGTMLNNTTQSLGSKSVFYAALS